MTAIKEITFGDIKFYLSNSLPENECISFYESFFDRVAIEKSEEVTTRGGRGNTLLFKKNGQNLVLRHYKRGGLFGKIVKDNFFNFEPHSHRALEEFALLNKMVELGLPVPEPVIAKEIKTLLGIRQDIVIKRLEGYSDLSYIIAKRDMTEEEYKTIGKTLKKFFDNNILHTDLNIRNILMNPDGKVSVIDFDKCRQTPLTSTSKEKMIKRLLRSFRKEVELTNLHKVFFNESNFKFLSQEALRN